MEGARRPVIQGAGRSPLLPATRPDLLETEQPRGPPRRPAALRGVVDQVEQAALTCASTRGGTGPVISTNALSLV